MNANFVCDTVRSELSTLDSELSHLLGKVEHLSTGERERVVSIFGDLEILRASIEDRIEHLESECPIQGARFFSPESEGHVDVRSQWPESVEAIGRAAPWSVPG